MSELGQWTKTAKLDKGLLRTALSLTMSESKQQNLAFVGILTVSDFCANGSQTDVAAQNIQKQLSNMKKYQVVVKVRKILSCDSTEVTNTLKDWADNLSLDLIFTLGGCGVQLKDVTPEATKSIIEKEAYGISLAMALGGQKLNTNAMLFRGIAGIRNNVLIVNLPGNSNDVTNYLDIIMPCLPSVMDSFKNDSSVPPQRPLSVTSSTAMEQSRSHEIPLEHTPVTISSIHSIHHSTPFNAQYFPSLTGEPHHNAQYSYGRHASVMPPHTSDTADPAGHELTAERPAQITEDELLEGYSSIDDVVVQEARHVVGGIPVGISVSDSAVSGLDSLNRPARRPRISPYGGLSVDRAYATIFALSTPLPVISLFYRDAVDYVVAVDITALGSIPPQPTSILDGYAVIASDTPSEFEVISTSSCRVLPIGKGVRVTTGAPVPPGANAVIPVEETLLISESNNGSDELMVRCVESASPGQHIRPEGSDVMKGDVILRAGTRLSSLNVAFLASVGIGNIHVHKLPVVAVISYGKKLREPDQTQLSPGEIRDTNRMTLLLDLKKKGFPTVDMGIVLGDPTELKDRLVLAYTKADVIITTGGAAMGENDCVKPLLEEIGCSLHVAKIFMRPGAPTSFATLETQRGKKYFFALSGLPLPAFIGYYLFVLPCLRRLSGIEDPRIVTKKVRVATDTRLEAVPDYKRVCLRDDSSSNIPLADITGQQTITRMISLVQADALLVLPAKTDQRLFIARGEIVDAIMIS